MFTEEYTTINISPLWSLSGKSQNFHFVTYLNNMDKITTEMYEALKAPLPPEAVKAHPTKTYLSSIKAIYVTERLNDVFGCGAWQIRTQLVTESDKGMVVVKVTLEIPEYGVYYESFGGNDNGGEQSKNFDLGDAYKWATTDWITKIGSYLGIGISVFQWKGNTQWNNAPTSNATTPSATTPTKTYPKGRADEIMAEMEIVEDLEQLKTLFEELLPLAKSEAQEKFYTSVKDKHKKRIGSKDVHAMANGIFK